MSPYVITSLRDSFRSYIHLRYTVASVRLSPLGNFPHKKKPFHIQSSSTLRVFLLQVRYSFPFLFFFSLSLSLTLRCILLNRVVSYMRESLFVMVQFRKSTIYFHSLGIFCVESLRVVRHLYI